MPRLEGLVAIVTGGGQGFGQGIVKRFVEEGAQVVSFDLQKAPSTEIKGCIHFQGNVTKEADWREVVSIQGMREQDVAAMLTILTGGSRSEALWKAANHRRQQCRMDIQSKADNGRH